MKSLEDNRAEYERLIEVFKAHDIGYFFYNGILVEVAHIEATSKLASIVETAMYFATEPNPGQLSVTGKSLSTVFGT
jgi:hypothetical protein